MAILKSQFPMVGSLGEFSFYTRADSNKIIVRRKGGPSKKNILTSPRFVNTRHNMAEFGGRSTAAKFIANSLRHLKIVARGTVANALNRPLKSIQDLDPASRKGERHILLSRNPILLEGFSIHKARTFESVMSTPLLTAVFPESGTAEITIPKVIPRTNLHLPDRFPFYRFVFTFAIVPDFLYSKGGYVPNIPDLAHTTQTDWSTEWVPAKGRFPGEQFSMSVQKPKSDAPYVFMLGAAIQLGMPSENGDIESVKYQGAGKIVRIVASAN